MACEYNGSILKNVAEKKWAKAINHFFESNAFIAVLSIAGVLLSVVAIISPVIISLKIYDKSPKESIVGSKAILYFALLIGIFIIVLGIL